MTIVIVPPNTWHPIHTTGTPPAPNQPDHRMVTECYHTNLGNILLTVSNDADGDITVDPVHDDPLCRCGNFKLRTIPYEDHTYQQLTQAHQPVERG